MDGIGAGDDETKNRVPALVVRYPFLICVAQNNGAFRAKYDLFERIDKVLVVDLVLLAARGEQRRLVDEVSYICSRHPRSGLRKLREIDIVRERNLAGRTLKIASRPFLSRD